MPTGPRLPDLDAMTGPIDAATDAEVLRAELQRSFAALEGAGSAAPAMWSAVLRHGVAAGVRLTPGVAAGSVVWLLSGSVARG